MRLTSTLQLEASAFLLIPFATGIEWGPSPHVPTPYPWGDSLFGEWNIDGSHYRNAGVNDIRHIGWSWSSIPTMAPSCSTAYTNTSSSGWSMSGCTTLDEACEKVGGSTWNDNICMETDKLFTVVGPDCWMKQCATYERKVAIQQTCEEDLNGQYVSSGAYATPDGDSQGSGWCLVPGRHTVVGPACYGETCYEDSLREVCSSLNGIVYADLYCVLDSKYSVLGPICHPGSDGLCFPEQTANTCAAVGGHAIGGIFCVVFGAHSTLGPFCSMIGSNETECYPDQGREACDQIGGDAFGDGLFCLVAGNDYHFYNDIYQGGCVAIGTKDGACETDFQGISVMGCSCLFKGDYTLGAPTVWGNTNFRVSDRKREDLAFDGQGFILKGSHKLYGPSCYGSSCNTDTLDCTKAGGVSIGGIFCAIPSKKKLLTFSSEAGLPNGIVFILSFLSVIIVLQCIALLVCWRRKQIVDENHKVLEPTEDSTDRKPETTSENP